MIACEAEKQITLQKNIAALRYSDSVETKKQALMNIYASELYDPLWPKTVSVGGQCSVVQPCVFDAFCINEYSNGDIVIAANTNHVVVCNYSGLIALKYSVFKVEFPQQPRKV